MVQQSINRSIWWLCLGLACSFGLAAPAFAERRVALVLGNDAYMNVDRLEKAVNDSKTVATVLASVGFEVVQAENLGRRDLNRALVDFTTGLGRDDVALFFYAGHGVEIEGRNYILPTDIPAGGPGDEQFVRSEAIAVDQVLDAIHRSGARVSILIIDACRDNPFARQGTRSLGGTRGLARMAPSAGTFIMYSAGVGQTALDRLKAGDQNPNSVFTRSLAPLLAEPGVTLTETARRVRRSVEQLSRSVAHEQRPAYYDEVSGDFYIAGRDPVATATPVSGTGAPSPNTAAVAWGVTKDTDSQAVLEAFIGQFPGTVYATLARARLEELRASATQTPKVEEIVAVTVPQSPPEPEPVQTLTVHYLTGLSATNDNWLALRTSPNRSGRRLAKMGPETLLRVVGRQGSWLEVVVHNTGLAGRRGWAHTNYIACCREVPASPGLAPSPQQARTDTLHYLTGLDPSKDNWLALRSAPHAGGQRLAKMGPETLLRIVGRQGVWLEVVVQNTAFSSYRGWAHANYIACCREVPAH